MNAILPAESPALDVEDALNQIGRLFTGPSAWERVLRIVITLVICLTVMKILLAVLERVITRGKVERSLHTFLKSGVKILLWLITIIILAPCFNIDPTSLLGLLGIIGLALSLAIQGTLSNLAGGIMILASKPFVVGDYIEAGSVGGTVYDIGLVYTRVKTFDNKIIFIPNGEISGEKITNYTSQETRRVDLKFNTSYGDDPELVKSCIRRVVGAHPKALFSPEPFIRVSGYLESSVEYTVRVWCATQDYWELYSDLLEQVKTAFDKAGVEMTYNHLNVHLVEDKSGRDLDR